MELFSQMKIGDLSLKNRMIMAPVKTGYGKPSGEANYRHFAYYRRRAEGGVAAIIVEPLFIDPVGKEHPKQLGISSLNHVEGLKQLTDAIHEGGSLAIAHLNHAGRAANPKASGSQPEAPSEVPCPSTGATPIPMTIGRIEEIVLEYAAASRRAIEAGFDIIEIQFGLGYLISQFYSESTNLRQDKYGGSPDKRMRFGKEVLSAIKDVVKSRAPVIAIISASLKGDGSDIQEAVILAQMLEEESGVNAIHIASGSACDSPPWYYQHMRLPAGKNLEWATKIKQEVSIPVIVARRMGNPSEIRRALKENLVDAIALGRPLVADPDLPNKMKESRDEDVAQCGACLQGCLAKVKSGEGLGCIINPEVGRESELLKKAESAKKVVVVGSGPAGMQAALTAQKRGFNVILFGDEDLGGQFKLAVIPPGKDMMKLPLDAMIYKIKKSEITLHLGKKVSTEDILAEHPDQVIIATGSEPIVPMIEGLENVLVSSDVLLDKKETGHRVLIIGGGMVGLETAEFLAAKQHDVVVVEMLEDVARDMELITKKLIMKRLEALHVTIHKQTMLKRFVGRRAFIMDNGEEKLLGEFDSVVVTVGVSSVDELADELRQNNVPVRLIGDARKPGNIVEAVADGYQVGREL